MAVKHDDTLTLRVTVGSRAWLQIGRALEADLGPWGYYEYEQMTQWFLSQKAHYEPLSDRAPYFYLLKFNNADDKLEFVLKWL